MHILELMKCGLQVLAIILLFSPKKYIWDIVLYWYKDSFSPFKKEGCIVIHCVGEPSITLPSPVSFPSMAATNNPAMNNLVDMSFGKSVRMSVGSVPRIGTAG